MKRILTILISIPATLLLAFLLSILLLAATGRGQSQTNQIALRLEKLESAVIWTNAPYNRTGTNTSYGVVLHVPTTEETVRKLAASGEICKVFGHWVEEVKTIRFGFVETTYRCKLCGKVRTKTEVWK